MSIRDQLHVNHSSTRGTAIVVFLVINLFPLVRGEIFERGLARRAAPSIRGRTLFVRGCRGEAGAEDRGA